MQWANKGKCSSLASQYAYLAVTQIHMFSNIYREDTDHLPGKAMGEIDLMSRMTDDKTLDSERIRTVCPSLTASLVIDMDTSIVHALFNLCDPSVQLLYEADHHIAFQKVDAIVQTLIL